MIIYFRFEDQINHQNLNQKNLFSELEVISLFKFLELESDLSTKFITSKGRLN